MIMPRFLVESRGKIKAFSIWRRPGLRLWAKIISLVITLAFVFPYLTFAFTPAAYPRPVNEILFNQHPMQIPRNLGAVQEVNQSGRQMVVYIQDLHCNYEVQSNIARLIDSLAAQHGLNLVTVEGMDRPVDVSRLSGIPLETVKQDVAEYLMREGKLSGPEHYAVLGKHLIHLEGIETGRLYQTNYDAVQQFLNSESQGCVYDLREELNELKPAIYNRDLMRLDEQKNAYREGKAPLAKYSAYLAGCARRAGMDLAHYSNLSRYLMRKTELFGEDIDADQLYGELDGLEQALRDGLFTSAAQQELDAWERRLDVMEMLVNISITPEELAKFRQDREQFRVSALKAFIAAHGGAGEDVADGDARALDQYLDQAADFYRVADERSRSFVDNLLAKMRQRNTNLAVLITGGYHSAEVLAELKRSEVSYVSVKPKLTYQNVVNPYFALLKNRKAPLEKLLARNQNLFALPSYVDNPLHKLFITTVAVLAAIPRGGVQALADYINSAVEVIKDVKKAGLEVAQVQAGAKKFTAVYSTAGKVKGAIENLKLSMPCAIISGAIEIENVKTEAEKFQFNLPQKIIGFLSALPRRFRAGFPEMRLGFWFPKADLKPQSALEAKIDQIYEKGRRVAEEKLTSLTKKYAGQISDLEIKKITRTRNSPVDGKPAYWVELTRSDQNSFTLDADIKLIVIAEEGRIKHIYMAEIPSKTFMELQQQNSNISLDAQDELDRFNYVEIKPELLTGALQKEAARLKNELLRKFSDTWTESIAAGDKAVDVLSAPTKTELKKMLSSSAGAEIDHLLRQTETDELSLSPSLIEINDLEQTVHGEYAGRFKPLTRNILMRKGATPGDFVHELIHSVFDAWQKAEKEIHEADARQSSREHLRAEVKIFTPEAYWKEDLLGPREKSEAKDEKQVRADKLQNVRDSLLNEAHRKLMEHIAKDYGHKIPGEQELQNGRTITSAEYDWLLNEMLAYMVGNIFKGEGTIGPYAITDDDIKILYDNGLLDKETIVGRSADGAIAITTQKKSKPAEGILKRVTDVLASFIETPLTLAMALAAWAGIPGMARLFGKLHPRAKRERIADFMDDLIRRTPSGVLTGLIAGAVTLGQIAPLTGNWNLALQAAALVAAGVIGLTHMLPHLRYNISNPRYSANLFDRMAKKHKPQLLPKDEAEDLLENFVSAVESDRRQFKGSVIDLPQDKEIIVVPDLHGRLEVLKQILNQDGNLDKLKTGQAVMVFLGDAVHREDEEGLREMDSSVEIMQFIMKLKLYNEHTRAGVYYLLGNHDYLWGGFTKRDVPQGEVYKQKLQDAYGEKYVNQYEEFLADSPLLAAGGGLVLCHAGPVTYEVTLDDIRETDAAAYQGPITRELQWNRYKSKTDYDQELFPRRAYTDRHVDEFLTNLGQKDGILVTGHTHNDEWFTWHGYHHVVMNDGGPEKKVGYASYQGGKLKLVEVTRGSADLPEEALKRPATDTSGEETKEETRPEKLKSQDTQPQQQAPAAEKKTERARQARQERPGREKSTEKEITIFRVENPGKGRSPRQRLAIPAVLADREIRAGRLERVADPNGNLSRVRVKNGVEPETYIQNLWMGISKLEPAERDVLVRRLQAEMFGKRTLIKVEGTGEGGLLLDAEDEEESLFALSKSYSNDKSYAKNEVMEAIVIGEVVPCLSPGGARVQLCEMSAPSTYGTMKRRMWKGKPRLPAERELQQYFRKNKLVKVEAGEEVYFIPAKKAEIDLYNRWLKPVQFKDGTVIGLQANVEGRVEQNEYEEYLDRLSTLDKQAKEQHKPASLLYWVFKAAGFDDSQIIGRWTVQQWGMAGGAVEAVGLAAAFAVLAPMVALPGALLGVWGLVLLMGGLHIPMMYLAGLKPRGPSFREALRGQLGVFAAYGLLASFGLHWFAFILPAALHVVKDYFELFMLRPEPASDRVKVETLPTLAQLIEESGENQALPIVQLVAKHLGPLADDIPATALMERIRYDEEGTKFLVSPETEANGDGVIIISVPKYFRAVFKPVSGKGRQGRGNALRMKFAEFVLGLQLRALAREAVQAGGEQAEEDELLALEYGDEVKTKTLKDIKTKGGTSLNEFYNNQKKPGQITGFTGVEIVKLLIAIRQIQNPKAGSELWDALDLERELNSGWVPSADRLIRALRTGRNQAEKDSITRMIFENLKTNLEQAEPAVKEVLASQIVELLVSSRNRELTQAQKMLLTAETPYTTFNALQKNYQIVAHDGKGMAGIVGKLEGELEKEETDPKVKRQLKFLRGILEQGVRNDNEGMRLELMLKTLAPSEEKIAEGQITAEHIGDDISHSAFVVVNGQVEEKLIEEKQKEGKTRKIAFAKPVVNTVFAGTTKEEGLAILKGKPSEERKIAVVEYAGKIDKLRDPEGDFEGQIGGDLRQKKAGVFENYLHEGDALPQAYYRWHENQSRQNLQLMVRVMIRVLKKQSGRIAMNPKLQTAYDESVLAVNTLLAKSKIFKARLTEIGTTYHKTGKTENLSAPGFLSMGTVLGYVTVCEKMSRFEINPLLQQMLERRQTLNFTFGGAA